MSESDLKTKTEAESTVDATQEVDIVNVGEDEGLTCSSQSSRTVSPTKKHSFPKWRVGDSVTVYSVSAKKWYPGEVSRVYEHDSDDDAENDMEEGYEDHDGGAAEKLPKKKKKSYVSVRYWIGETHRAKRATSDSPFVRRVQRGVNRFDWTLGTLLQCWSNTHQKWFDARVTEITHFEGGYDSDGHLDADKIFIELQWELVNSNNGDTKRLSKEFALSSYWIRFCANPTTTLLTNATDSDSIVSTPTAADSKSVDISQKSVVSGSKDGSEDKAIADTKAALGLPKNVSADGSGARKRRTKGRAVRSGKSQKSKATRRRTQRRTTAIESVMSSLLDPNSEVVYFLANGALAAMLFILLVLYLIRPNFHFIIMALLALGLLFSVNFVWTHRIRQPKERKSKKKKSDKAQKRTRKRKDATALEEVVEETKVASDDKPKPCDVSTLSKKDA